MEAVAEVEAVVEVETATASAATTVATATVTAVGTGEGVQEAAGAEPTATLADVGDITGRHNVPESTIGGETTCIVCMTHPKTHLAAPCGHQCACATCADRMQHCPYCREPVAMWIRQRMV